MLYEFLATGNRDNNHKRASFITHLSHAKLTLSVRGLTLDVRLWRPKSITNPFSGRTDFRRQILTSKVDHRTDRIKIL